MSYEDFRKAWNQAVQDFICGLISYDQLMEYGTLDEYLEYMEEFKNEDEQPDTF